MRSSGSPGSWPPSAAEFRCVSLTLHLHLKTSNLFPEFGDKLMAAKWTVLTSHAPAGVRIALPRRGLRPVPTPVPARPAPAATRPGRPAPAPRRSRRAVSICSLIVTRPSCQPRSGTGRCSGADRSVVTGTPSIGGPVRLVPSRGHPDSRCLPGAAARGAEGHPDDAGLAAAALLCRIVRASSRARSSQRRPCRAEHRRALRPTATSRPQLPASSGGAGEPGPISALTAASSLSTSAATRLRRAPAGGRRCCCRRLRALRTGAARPGHPRGRAS